MDQWIEDLEIIQTVYGVNIMKHNPWIILDTVQDVARMHADILSHGFYVTERGKIFSNIRPGTTGRTRRLGTQIIVEEQINDLECIRTVYEAL